MNNLIKNIFNFIKPLFCDNGGGMSIGRLGLWFTMAPAIEIWYSGNDIKENHLYVLVIFTVYNMYKKIPQFIDLIKAWKGNN